MPWLKKDTTFFLKIEIHVKKGTDAGRAPEGLNSKRRKLSLLVIVAMTFMATLDLSIVNVALPVMSDEMHVPLSFIEWVVTGYSIMICAMLLFFGRPGDLVGKSRVFQAAYLLLSVFRWNSVFWVNVPIGVIVYIAGLRLLPRNRPSGERMNWPGSVLQFFATILFFGTLIEVQKLGFLLSPLILAVLASVCGALSDRFSSELITLLGLLVMSVGFFCMSILDEFSPVVPGAVFVAGVTRSVKIAQIESRTQACLSMTEMQAITRSVNTLCIDAFGIRFGASSLDSERVRYLRYSA